ncbi:phosphoribosylformylglycinamidine cyclo-ligase [Weissella cibaria]|uniref:phosphoribosylformylglycinamidine cyclo-ligase n=1 Tax=Weissella cibaria TaxID=137591 RepID=UPI00143F87E6|nr:phosphoribosylformylglycinamidine cyclo-ligase [Weissella cibaria]NKN30447.1 phosphoribosylformylglycinamidine cyclo-ligase [Weissella cibaria]NKN79336.1 phosphoribosylformylglycinamidine cyclo-ligase [Weissella cibaria]NKN97266.1 phosphoribosylformylglycinamidine cyclo-ligase [Weissella cibaria]NKN99622.1 phosphoribosylformylglycinamidine cyclo-ligase [Weissella cibaria]
MTEANAYAGAGVDILAGETAVDMMQADVAATYTPGVLAGVGGFGAAFALGTQYREPVLISGTDGVGTKLLLTIMAGRHESIGQDLVAMVMNDIVAQGAKPLFLLDYLAIAKMVPEQVATIVRGIAQATQATGAALIGGESAELPGMYAPDHYDLAAFGVGVVERDEMLTVDRVATGDVLIGLASSGIHSNGYSLVRTVLGLEQEADFTALPTTLQETLLTPTTLYAQAVLPLLAEQLVVSMAHITGGGIVGNLPRALPADVSVTLEWGSWPILPIFMELQRLGQLSLADMLATFNLGLGMILVVKPPNVARVLAMLADEGQAAYQVGTVTLAMSAQLNWRGKQPWS